MKAMILAAGIGSRLRPLTEDRPKALVEVGGVPLLELVLRRLLRAGVDQVIINAFHFADQIELYAAQKRKSGLRVEVSREERLLDTGGGLKNASWFFDDGRPFFLHNADVLSGVDLTELYRFHLKQEALATLCVRRRSSSRQLLFDPGGRLCGRRGPSGDQWSGALVEQAEALAFDGIHVISPRIFIEMTETGAFPILEAYLRLCGLGRRLAAFRCDGSFWSDTGSPEKLEAVRQLTQADGLPE